MNKAGDLAISRIEGAFSSLNPGLGGLASLGAVLAGAAGSLGALLAELKAVNAELAEIGKEADYVGVSTERLQQIKFGATQGGVSSSDARPISSTWPTCSPTPRATRTR
jgi:galactokinase